MKNEQQEEAKTLYFQTNMSKTEIAKATGVSRRTILRWCQQDNWETLRRSARHTPSLVAEKCYYLIDAFSSRLLQDPTFTTINLKDAQTIHLLAASIKKLKNYRKFHTKNTDKFFHFKYWVCENKDLAKKMNIDTEKN